jgi:hypothetical protein
LRVCKKTVILTNITFCGIIFKVSAWFSNHAMCETGLNLPSFVYKGMHGAGWAEEEEGILHQPLYMYLHLCLPGHYFCTEITIKEFLH